MPPNNQAHGRRERLIHVPGNSKVNRMVVKTLFEISHGHYLVVCTDARYLKVGLARLTPHFLRPSPLRARHGIYRQRKVLNQGRREPGEGP